MNSATKYLVFIVGVNLAGCAMVPSLDEAVIHKVIVNGENYLLSPLTESTWVVSSTGVPKTLANTPAAVIAFQKAIETASGCKVTDSDYSREGKQFDAQVDCDRKLAN